MKTDLEIQKDVIDELKWEPFLNASEIGVSVKHGIVTLSGTVDAYSKKLSAENAAKRIAGVKAVAENIAIKLSDQWRKNDTEIAEAAYNAIKWHSAVQEDKIKIKVENGLVTLEGNVEWEYQRIAARKAIENLVGVKGVFNKINISPALSPADIKKKISFAFQRNASIDADRIVVESDGNKIILKGKVRSWAEKKDAENAAWMAPGISSVESKLEVDSTVFAY